MNLNFLISYHDVTEIQVLFCISGTRMYFKLRSLFSWTPREHNLPYHDMANHSGPVPTWLDAPYVTKILSEYLKLPDLKIKSMDITPGSKVGDNYCCQIFRISTVYISNGTETKLSLIGKYMVETQLMETIGGGTGFFDVEAAFYKIFAPKIKEISGKEDGVAPNMYFIDFENHILFMEDIIARDFKLQARDSLLTLEQCYLTIDALALLHGSSYYLMKENPSVKETFKKSFWGSERVEAMDAMYRNAENAIKNNIQNYGLSEQHQKKLLNVFETLRKDNLKVCDHKPEDLNVLLHGDCWKSNMMFHFKGKTADAVKLLDFQIVNFNCFANDLVYFLFSSVQTEVLIDNLENILKRYYEKLVETAPDMPGVSFERIKKEVEDRYFFGVVLSIIFRGMFFADKPLDFDDTFNGVETDLGYADERFIDSMKKFLAFFEKVGVI